MNNKIIYIKNANLYLENMKNNLNLAKICLKLHNNSTKGE